jgi:hypothetical protein
MTWEILDIESGDVIAAYDSFEVAKQKLCTYVDANPEMSDDVAIATIDDQGCAVGAFLTAENLAALA